MPPLAVTGNVISIAPSSLPRLPLLRMLGFFSGSQHNSLCCVCDCCPWRCCWLVSFFFLAFGDVFFAAIVAVLESSAGLLALLVLRICVCFFFFYCCSFFCICCFAIAVLFGTVCCKFEFKTFVIRDGGRRALHSVCVTCVPRTQSRVYDASPASPIEDVPALSYSTYIKGTSISALLLSTPSLSWVSFITWVFQRLRSCVRNPLWAKQTPHPPPPTPPHYSEGFSEYHRG